MLLRALTEIFPYFIKELFNVQRLTRFPNNYIRRVRKKIYIFYECNCNFFNPLSMSRMSRRKMIITIVCLLLFPDRSKIRETVGTPDISDTCVTGAALFRSVFLTRRGGQKGERGANS